MNPKILVATPTFFGMAYCFDKFIESIKSLDYDSFDILVVDNSDDSNFFKELEETEGIIKIKQNLSQKSNKIKLIESRNKILDYAKEKNYDYILMMDSDVLPPKDILSKLVSHNKDLVSGLYYNNFNKNNTLKWLPVCWKLLTEEEFDDFKKITPIPSHLTLKDCPRHLTPIEAESNELLEVFHPSAGCLLISKKVFNDFRYPILDAPNGSIYGDDVAFIKKCRENNLTIWCDTSIKCEHLIEGKYDKDSNGNLIHPISK